ncbi:hypothetical protein SAMD00019534_015080 [Acytostelium subglobosum LB1]|uniref:hypothetical protein n=1 Tax=Acytostelium subglobosum LB1 TaxID=1410327 RepID=UPI000644B81C|nr:hypothetical protein SAMD00019534_015080 [Acytostelium subglobosum LB1]GAM18333.1 hypothetical protein SAMD00019534_015080 [Acytostelium subglobosum LB1]|eukprot:XP_012757553.1 hypothetical protein SAMD00019534_015080 [Acytostelium subglobosum LB1]
MTQHNVEQQQQQQQQQDVDSDLDRQDQPHIEQQHDDVVPQHQDEQQHQQQHTSINHNNVHTIDQEQDHHIQQQQQQQLHHTQQQHQQQQHYPPQQYQQQQQQPQHQQHIPNNVNQPPVIKYTTNRRSRPNSAGNTPGGGKTEEERRDIAINETQDTVFDVILQWISLACSKLLFHPIEFPVHALTTFIQANPTPQPQPIGIPFPMPQQMNQQPQSSLAFTSESLWRLFKQKGTHIYDGGLVYLAHNMVVIIANFTQRFVNASFNTPTGNASVTSIERRQRIGKLVDLLISGVKNAFTLPLDVLMTRLIVHRFYKAADNLHYINDCTLGGICKNEGIISGLYAGWEVVVMKALLEWIYKKCDNHLVTSSKRGPFSPNEKSPAQIILLCLRVLLDYILTVVKVRLNIRNIGFIKTVVTIYRREGIKGFFSGLNTYLALFPLWMIGILFANVIFVKLKQMLERNADLSRRRGKKSSSSLADDDGTQPQAPGMSVIGLSPMETSDDDDDQDDENNSSDDERVVVNRTSINSNYNYNNNNNNIRTSNGDNNNTTQ